MKDIICIISADSSYSKKFVSQATKLLGKKYLFLAFTSIKALIEYTHDNNVFAVIIEENTIKDFSEVKAKYFYILCEKKGEPRKDGRKTYIYKLQNAKKIFDIVDEDANKEKKEDEKLTGNKNKLVVFYTPYDMDALSDKVRKVAKYTNKKRKTLLIYLDEYSNYKSSEGLSNIIFNYKENLIDEKNITKEINFDDEVDTIKSVAYPEDFSVINNIDLSNIINHIRNLDYEYVFAVCDSSYVKNQYLFNDADKIIVMYEDLKKVDKIDKFKSFVKSQSSFDIAKIINYKENKEMKNYNQSFARDVFINGK